MDFVMSDRHRVTFGKNQQGAAHAALLALLFLVLLPLAAALPSLRIDQIKDASTLLVFSGRASGILGLSLLLLGALISIRVPGFDLWFGGLTRLWKIHHILGAASFLLLMAHPLLLAFGSAHVSVQAAAAVLFPEWNGCLRLRELPLSARMLAPASARRSRAAESRVRCRSAARAAPLAVPGFPASSPALRS